MVRRIRLASGLILLAFVTSHLINHALGLISLGALETGRAGFLGLWRTGPGSLLLYGALACHVALALWAIFQRRTFRMPLVDWVQLSLGLLIPLLLVSHVLNTRYAHEILGLNDSYTYELTLFFVLAPILAYKQSLLLLVVWVHGVIGLHQWLKLKAFYRRMFWLWYGLYLLVPLLALLGTWVAGRDARRLAADQAWLDLVLAQANPLDLDQLAELARLETWVLIACAAALLGALLLRPLRQHLRRRLGLVQISYPRGRRVTVPKGTSVLDASQQNGISHASVCGGRGRCSTCRVRIGRGADTLPAASAEESRVLERIGAAANVRLACQVRPLLDCEVTPLLPSSTTAGSVTREPSFAQGQEREIVVLFADLRGFTTLSENKLPYDVVFLLNRYFAAMGQAIERSGGTLDKFVGDGVMALFGLSTTPPVAARTALKAARAMTKELEQLNRELETDLPAPLRIGIGLHGGPAIVGRMGYGTASGLTAVGDTVNIASRLESASKDFAVQIVVSDRVMQLAGLTGLAYETREVTLRGRERPLTVHLVPDGDSL